MSYTYLLVNLASIFVPFIYSFHPKLKFHKRWKAFFPAMAITAAIFIVWDVFFTDWGVWSFNSDYLTGVYLVNLPIEEWLFFICIPYACVFTFHCFDQLHSKNVFSRIEPYVSILLPLILLFLAAFNHQKLYTSVTFVSLAVGIFLFRFLFAFNWMNQFYFSYLVLLLPFLIVNGILTGTGLDAPVVMYNDSENLGIRIMTIPVEDVFYGMLLILMNVGLMKYFEKRYKSN